MTREVRLNILAVVAAIGAAMSTEVTLAQNEDKGSVEEARNVELTNAAWKAYKDHDYELAIKAAERCVNRFKSEADGQQSELVNKHAKEPPIGRVSREQRDLILAQGVLNDVATCLWIEGTSAAKLHRNEQARKAYEETKAYSYARTWDPKRGFWSPAQDAEDRILDLK